MITATRHTTSSRRPGSNTGGSFSYEPERLALCPRCGGTTYARSLDFHSPHFDAGALVDCVGFVIREAIR